MRKEVEEFLQKREKENNTAKKQARDLHLLELGLFRIEYWEDFCRAQGDGADVSQMESEFQEFVNGQRCRKILLDVTDAEYAAICTKEPEEPKGIWPVWPVQKILFVLAIVVYVSGFCIGIAAGYFNTYFRIFTNGMGDIPFQFTAAISAWLGSAVSGSLLLAASKHLRLMEKLTEKM